MRALVTGATGFIGSHLVEELLRRGVSVRCLIRRTSDTRFLKKLGVELVPGDYEDTESLATAVAGADHVFHLAAALTAMEWETYRLANVEATKNLLEACLTHDPGLRRFVFVSSISAAGPSAKGRARTEEDPSAPISDYGRSKLLAEEAVKDYGRRFPAVIIRPPNVIGPRQRELKEAINLVRRRIMPVIGTGEPQTSLCYVGDVVEALILAAEHPRAVGRTYFVADPRPYAWREINQAIARALGLRGPVLKVHYPLQLLAAALSEIAARIGKKRPRLTKNYVRSARFGCWIYDASRIRRELGFETKTGMEQAVAETVAWFLANRGA